MPIKKKILVTGARGLVGSSFISDIFNYDTYLMDEIVESRGTVFICPHHSRMDISKRSEVLHYIERFKPDTIINFAAHRNANTAEDQRNSKDGSAWKSNVTGARNISTLCEHYGIYLIHISTDMVFSGYKDNKGPYSETSPTEREFNKLSWYGWTKKIGEDYIGRNGNAAIVRIANVTRPVYDATLDYVGKILWLYDNDKLYPMFDDQFATLTYIPHVTDTILALLKRKPKGVFHVASTNMFTPYKLARRLCNRMGLEESRIKGISIDSYLRDKPNRYPQYGGLSSSETQRKLGVKFSTWEEIVDQFAKYVEELRL